MNEVKKQSDSELNTKVRTDGLSKKERRALKVAKKTGNENNVRERSEILPKTTSKDKSADGQSKIKSQCKDQVQNKINGRDSEKDTWHQRLPKLDTVEQVHKLKSDVVNTPTPVETKGKELKSLQNVAELNAKEGIKKPEDDTKTKSQLKAERRALQEKQRLAKQNVKPEGEIKTEIAKPAIKAPKKILKFVQQTTSENQVYLFNHLYFQSLFANESTEVIAGVHSAFIRLGVQYSSKTILGSNARCLALLAALKELISCFVTPPKQEFCRSLESALQKCSAHLQKCRPHAVSMTNALKNFNLILTQIDTNLSDSDKKEKLLYDIDVYRQEQIAKAGEAISLKVNEKIANDDIILTYGCSSLIRRLLLDAHTQGKKFKVIIIDSRPLLEGREMLRVLTNHDIDCTYMLINSVSFIMSKATKVLLGAHALLANGYVMSRTGTAQVALIAQAHNKPVLVCCETYKFCERVQTDCFVYNEIGDPDKLITVDTLDEESPLKKWRNCKSLTPLNLLYDVTPPDFVTAVVTELGFLPCTSVPVVLRIKPTE